MKEGPEERWTVEKIVNSQVHFQVSVLYQCFTLESCYLTTLLTVSSDARA